MRSTLRILTLVLLCTWLVQCGENKKKTDAAVVNDPRDARLPAGWDGTTDWQESSFSFDE